MPGKEIKGRSKIATYSHGGRIGLKRGGGISETSKKQSLELREKKRNKFWEKEREYFEFEKKVEKGKKKL